MTREDRFTAALKTVPGECRVALEPLLRVLVHDLNGVLSAATMEAFTIRCLTESFEPSGVFRAGDTLGVLHGSATNLKRATDDAVSYLRHIEALTDEIGESAPISDAVTDLYPKREES